MEEDDDDFHCFQEHEQDGEAWAGFSSSIASDTAAQECDSGWATFESGKQEEVPSDNWRASFKECFLAPKCPGSCEMFQSSQVLQERFVELLGRRSVAREALLRERTGAWLAWIAPLLEQWQLHQPKREVELSASDEDKLATYFNVHSLAGSGIPEQDADQDLDSLLLGPTPFASSLPRLNRQSLWWSRQGATSRRNSTGADSEDNSPVTSQNGPLPPVPSLVTSSEDMVQDGIVFAAGSGTADSTSLSMELPVEKRRPLSRTVLERSVSRSSTSSIPSFDDSVLPSPSGFCPDVVVAGLGKLSLDALEAMRDEMHEKVQRLSDDLVTGLTRRDQLSRSLKVRHEFVASLLRLQSVICNHQLATSQSSMSRRPVNSRSRNPPTKFLSSVIIYKESSGGIPVCTLERLTKILDAMANGDDCVPTLMSSYLETDVFGTTPPDSPCPSETDRNAGTTTQPFVVNGCLAPDNNSHQP